MTTYHVNLSRILDQTGGDVRVSDDIALERLTVGDVEFVFTGPVHVEATVTNASGGVVAFGHVAAPATTMCTRCLCDFGMTLAGDLEGFYIQHGREETIPDEQDYAFIEDGKIDLMPVILEALAIEAPFAPVHAEDCAGICPTCGADLSEGPCGCAPEAAESPFGVLKTLLGEQGGGAGGRDEDEGAGAGDEEPDERP